MTITTKPKNLQGVRLNLSFSSFQPEYNEKIKVLCGGWNFMREILRFKRRFYVFIKDMDPPFNILHCNIKFMIYKYVLDKVIIDFNEETLLKKP